MAMIQITVVGDGFVGKTTLLYRFTKNKLTDGYEPTVFENYSGEIVVDGEEHKIQLWDTAGQEGYDRLRVLAYRATTCCVVCFAINARSTFQNVREIWMKEIKSNKKNMPVVLVGTKGDLRNDPAESLVSVNEAMDLKKKIKAVAYVECSSITGENVFEVFAAAVRGSTRKKSSNCSIL